LTKRLSGIGLLLRIRGIDNEFDKRVHAEFHEVEQRLRDNRPALTALELDAIKLRAMASDTEESTGLIARKKGTFMKSRFALVVILALGVFMSGTGATLALSGTSGSGSASSAQYPPEEHEKEEHLCESGSGSGSGSGGSSECSHESEHCGPTSSGGNGEACETQEVRQVESNGGGSLPFTGFLAIPVLIIGLGLLGAGVAMRLRMRSGDHTA
jgi:hypothetical protein